MRRRRTAPAVLLFALGLSAAAAVAQDLRPFTPQSLAQISAARAGRPFVLVFWSLDCAQCQEELAALGRRPTASLVLVSTDTWARRDAVRTALARYGLSGAEAWVFADEFGERLRAAVDRAWLGELPRIYFYAADGTRQGVSGRPPAALLDHWLGQARSR